jgi:general secretion pathway protein B
MSLILEALRKSEAERRRGNTPDVAMELPPAPLRTRNATPAWLWAVLLATIVVVALAWWLADRRDTVVPGAPTVGATAVEPEPEATAPAVVPRTPVDAPATTAPAPVQAPQMPESDVDARRVAAIPSPTPTRTRDVSPEPVIIPPPAPVPAATSMSGVKLSMHMWDASADKRFVILNGQRMSEGDRNGNVQVIAIERDGVVVEREGQRARVPLP